MCFGVFQFADLVPKTFVGEVDLRKCATVCLVLFYHSPVIPC